MIGPAAAGAVAGAGSTSYRALHVERHDHAIVDVRAADDWRAHDARLRGASARIEALRHPGIAVLLDRGTLPERGMAWVASACADGVLLSDLLAARPLTHDEVHALVHDLCEPIARAHERGLVHGAIIPERIVLRTGPRDFPIQLGGWHAVRDASTRTSAVELTRGPYAAPELAHGFIDRRADIYAIGAIARHALAGAPLGELAALVATDPRERPTVDHIRAWRAPRSRWFGRPRWTPSPDPQPDGERLSTVIDLAAARRTRS